MRNRSFLPSFFEVALPSQLDDTARQPFSLEVWNITYLHFHSSLELGVCVSGQGSCIVETHSQPFQAGDVQIIFPFQRHLSQSEGSEQSKWYWINVNPSQLLSGLSAVDLGRMERLINGHMGLCGIIDRVRYPLVAELVRRIVLPGAQAVRLASLYALLEVLAEESKDLPHLDLRPDSAFLRLEPALRQVQRALEQAYTPTIPELCTACRMSEASLRRSFHAVLGQSPQQYIRLCQMRMAQRLLLLTDESITQIALAVGYQDVSGFNRQFLRFFGCAPSSYRSGAKE